MLRRLICLFILCISAYSVCAQSRTSVQAEYYGELGCSHCDDFTDKLLPEAEAESGVIVELKIYDIISSEGYERCERRLEEEGFEFTVFPVLIIGNNAYQGNTAIETNFVPELKYYAEHGEYRPRITEENAPESGNKRMRLSFLPVFSAGLIDGVNPCAFATLLFFISFLSLRGRSRKQTALFGLVFAAGIFIAYFFIGLGLFNLLRMSMNFTLLRLVLKICVTAVTAVFCVLTIRDYFLIRQGKISEMSLQLPKQVKRRIHTSIRGGTGSTAFAAGVFLTGLFVAVLELACTGQIYFPTIAFMVQTDVTWLGIGSLVLYNFAFIVPLLAVLCIVLFGVRHERIASFFKKHLGAAKLSMALLFAALAGLVWIF
ncbi:MAG: cytochrome c biogenesis CcdA family protein [Spirochaetia bacterium]